MINIFSRKNPHFKGGLEQFNNVMCSTFQKNNVKHAEIIYDLDFYINTFFYYTILIYKAIKKNEVENIIIQYGSFYDIISVFLLKKYYKRIYCIAHIGPMWFHLRNKTFKKISIYILKKYCYKIYLISREQEQIFSDIKHKKRINTIIEENFFTQEPSKATGREKYYLYYGRISKDKGISNLIDAFVENFKDEKACLYLAGDFDDNKFKKKIIKKIEFYFMNNKIKFLGYISDKKQLIKLIDNCSAVIYPSFYDAFPLTVVEAYSRGKPCLCSNISETKYFVDDDKLLFDPSSLIELKKKWKNLDSLSFSEKQLKRKAKIFHPKSLADEIKKERFI